MKNKVNKAYLLETGIEISILREGDYLIINTPDEPVNPYVSVIVLEIEGEPEVKDGLVQEKDGRVLLETELAANSTGSEIKMGALLMWVKPEGKLKWTYNITSPGKFNLQVITTGRKRMATPEEPALWAGGHEVLIKLDDQEIFGIVDKDKVEDAPRDLYNDFKIAEMGKVEITETGLHTLKLIPKKIEKKNNAGLTVRMVRLIPTD